MEEYKCRVSIKFSLIDTKAQKANSMVETENVRRSKMEQKQHGECQSLHQKSLMRVSGIRINIRQESRQEYRQMM